jgi:hypothetical protein
MKRLRIHAVPVSGRLAGLVGLVLVVASLATAMSGSEADREGAAPYTPTRGEWLCLVLNTQRALVNSEQEPLDVHVRYLYDRAKPNTIQVELLFRPDLPEVELRRRAEEAQRHAKEAAKTHGWDGWLKIEFKETQLAGPPTWENIYR